MRLRFHWSGLAGIPMVWSAGIALASTKGTSRQSTPSAQHPGVLGVADELADGLAQPGVTSIPIARSRRLN